MEMVGQGRLELPTSRLSGVRSNRLSYRPGAKAGIPTLKPGTYPNVSTELIRKERETKTAAACFCLAIVTSIYP